MEWIITFGSDHLSGTGLHCFATIEAKDDWKAREIAFNNWGREWAFIYPSRELAGVEKYNLHCIDSLGV